MQPRILDTTKKLLTWLILGLLIYLPFHTIVSVFFTFKLGLGFVAYGKEIALILLCFGAILIHLQKRVIPKINTLDICILLYMCSLICISLIEGLGLRHIVYGGRYDFEFLIAFLAVRHTIAHIDLDIDEVMRVFLISGGCALFLGLCVRFLFGEHVLIPFGFSDAISNWNFNGAPPIYHGVAHASVERFQGIFDGPNQAGFFLLVYMGVFGSVFFKKKDYDVFNGLVIFVLLGLIVLTYSRSAYIGVITFTTIGIIGSVIQVYLRFHAKIQNTARAVRSTWSFFKRKYAKLFLALLGCFVLFVGGFLVMSSGKLEALIAREGSTYGHIERFTIGLLRFADKPFGSGLATVGPASRSLYEISHLDTDFVAPSTRIQKYLDTAASQNEHHEFTSESYYIPESWYIQQLVEGGIIGFAFFFAVILYIWLGVLVRKPWICAGFTGALTMNLVLHSFESMYTSLVLFIILGAILTASHTSDLGPTPKKIPSKK